MYVCMYVCMYVFMMYGCMYLNIHSCMYVYTRGFTAPEIVMEQGSYCASDIFSFAMTVIEIITRSAPNVSKHYKGRITSACDEFLARDDFKKDDIHPF